MLTNEMIACIIELFFKEVMVTLPDDQVICLLFKAEFKNEIYRTLTSQKVINQDLDGQLDGIKNQFSAIS